MIFYIIQSLGWIAAFMLLRQNSLLMTRINWLNLELHAHQLTVKRLERKLSRSPFSLAGSDESLMPVCYRIHRQLQREKAKESQNKPHGY